MNVDLQARAIEPQRHTFARVAAYIGDKTASRYQEATLGVQPTANFHYRPTWEPEFELFDTGRTAVKLADWYVLRDPRQYYYANWTMTRARQQDAMESNYQFVESRGLAAKIPDALRAKACEILLPLRHVAWGGNMNNTQVCARGYGTAFTAPAMLPAMDQLGVAQYLTRLGLALEEPGALDALGFDALRVIAAGCSGGTCTPSALQQRLPGLAVDGATGPLCFDAEGQRRGPLLLLQVEGARLRPVPAPRSAGAAGDGGGTCAPPPTS